ncbi:MAG: hypothetical protein ACREPV_00250 [Lysobacter sp.]
MNARLLRLLLTAPLALSPPAIAQQAATPSPATTAAPADTASIGGDAGRDLGGRGAINLAAGNGNAQANLAAIALSAGGQGMTTLRIRQDLQMSPAQQAELRQRDASARIDGHAFAGSTGLLSVNQVAGSGNAQLNVFALGNAGAAIAASGPTGLDDAVLAGVAGSNSTEGAAAPRGLRHVEIADGAFHGSQGVAQVNQTAGVGNVSANAIVLQLPGGTP